MNLSTNYTEFHTHTTKQTLNSQQTKEGQIQKRVDCAGVWRLIKIKIPNIIFTAFNAKYTKTRFLITCLSVVLRQTWPADPWLRVNLSPSGRTVKTRIAKQSTYIFILYILMVAQVPRLNGKQVKDRIVGVNSIWIYHGGKFQLLGTWRQYIIYSHIRRGFHAYLDQDIYTIRVTTEPDGRDIKCWAYGVGMCVCSEHNIIQS